MKPVIIAHRGASALARHENTLEAFEIAISIGADYAEFDIRQTKDKELIVFHNDNINNLKINSITYNELCNITSEKGYRVPLLSEVLKLCCGRIKLDIELKESGYENRIISMVKELYPYGDFMMKSFLDTTVARIKAIDPDITTGLLLGFYKGDLKRRINEYFPERRLRSCHADFVSPHYQLATAEFITRMHLLRKKVYVWTINDPKQIGKYILRRADGIISDTPDAALHLREGYHLINKIKNKLEDHSVFATIINKNK